MTITTDDLVPLNKVRASFTALAEAVRAGREKLVTKNGEAYVALIDPARLDHYHRLEREHIHIRLLEEAVRGLEDVHSGNNRTPAELRKKYLRKARA